MSDDRPAEDPGAGAGPLGWLDDRLLDALASATTGATIGDDTLNGSIAVVVPASGGRPRRSRSAPPAAAVAVTVTVADGRITGLVPGGPEVAGGGPGAGAAPLATLTLPAGDALGVLEGRVEPSVAFMQGRLKTDGAMRAVLAVLRSTATPQYRQGRDRLRASLAR